MTLIKSLLLGSAAGLVAVSAAQAADLPTRKGPVAAEYVRVCSITVAGAPVVGFVLPGSDTCIKFSGYITGQVEGGNLKTGYALNYNAGTPTATLNGTTAIAAGVQNGNSLTAAGTPAGSAGVGAAVAANAAYFKQAAYTGTQTATTAQNRDSVGFSTRLNFGFDAVSNTAYGPLVGHAEMQFDRGAGFDTIGAAGGNGYVNRAYVTWAGLTAGRANSFFSFTGGGLAWANFFSPDRNGSNQPDLLAYTASFGGGFSATIALESARGGGPATGPGGSSIGFLNGETWAGYRAPDIVGSLDVHQGWGTAHLSGVAHNVRANSGVTAAVASTLDRWGFAIDAGVQFNIPSLPGSSIGVTGAWSKSATWYSGLPDGMWGENGAVNGNGQAMALADAFYNGTPGTGWATPTAWSITGYGQFQVSAPLTLGLEASYGQNSWSGTTAGTLLYNSKSFIVGGVANYTPVKNLVFEFELLYQSTTNSQPAGFVSSAAVPTWQGSANGFAARFEVTRNF